MAAYFKTPHLLWWLAIPLAMGLNFVAWWNVSLISPVYLGPVGRFAIWLGREQPGVVYGLNVFTLVAHIAEASVAALLSLSKGTRATLRWTLQTFILGFPSLIILLRYQPAKTSRKSR